MGKRRTTIVVSSDDDEGENDFVLNSNSSYCKLKVPPQSSSAPPLRTNPKRAKKAARVSNSGSRSRSDSNPFDEIKLFCEGFDDGFTGFKVFAGDEKSKKKELWVDKYKPLSLEELAVHKKKVEEVTTWFEDRLRRSEEDRCNHVLLITGQAGVGKSATVHVIASQLGAQVCEWNTPTPTIWQEHAHNSGSGIHYTSKLDEFENFVERIRKYGLISSSNTDGSQKSTVLLIDDLPVINGKAAYRRLQSSLHLLVRSIHIPTALIITDYGQADSADYTMRCWDALQLSLQSAGTCKVAFNPITVNSIKKTLSRICRDEHCSVTAEHIDLIAKASGGDIRHAITSLQYFCLKLNPMLSLSISNGTPAYQQESSALNYGVSLPFGRDETLSLFHALGKFLHNKRESQDSITSVDKDAVCLRERFRRLPLKMELPEKVLCQAHGQARTTTDFLHENVLDFLSEEAIEDAWAVSSYLSDADSLLASFSGLLIRNSETENVVQSAAASVAARGVLFGNSQPLSSRWHSVRRPKIWEVEQSLWRNKSAMVRQRSAVYNGMNLSDLPVIATEFRPVLKWLGYRASQNLEDACHIKMNTDMVEDDDSYDCTRMDGQNNETGSDDEIEDW